VFVAECGWQGNTEWEAGRTRLWIRVLAPERDRLIAEHRRRRTPTRHLLHLEQALDLYPFHGIFVLKFQIEILGFSAQMDETRTRIATKTRPLGLDSSSLPSTGPRMPNTGTVALSVCL
jgi:hypothetical protein